MGKKKSKPVTIDDILALPDGPDDPESVARLDATTREAIDVFFKMRGMYHRASDDLVDGYNAAQHDWWRVALEVCKATGLQPAAFNRLNQRDAITVVRQAASMKTEQRQQLLDALRRLAKERDVWSAPASPREWGKRFNVHAETFKRWCRNGKIRHQKISDRSYRVHVDDLPK